MRPWIAVAPASLLLALAAACAVPSDPGTSTTTTTARTAHPPDPTKLPIGDGKHTTAGPTKGYVYSCQSTFNGGGASATGAWYNGAAGTWNSTIKPEVDGSVSWAAASFSNNLVGTTRQIVTNDLPINHTTGVFPIRTTDDAYQYDHNPNSIKAQTAATVNLPANPALVANPSCLGMGTIGVTLSGVYLYNALDAGGRDAAAHEMQDHCDGHPQQVGAYHYHSLSDCLPDTSAANQHSDLIGYALDGFGIYGIKGEGGQELSTADLDECHGHTHTIMWDGHPVSMYHYHATQDYPYTIGCYRGK